MSRFTNHGKLFTVFITIILIFLLVVPLERISNVQAGVLGIGLRLAARHLLVMAAK